MNWITLLKQQQADFIERLKYGCLLHCDKIGQHSELTIISDEKLTQLRAFCWEMADKYKNMSLSSVRDVFINNLKGKLGEEVVKIYFGDLITEVDYEKRLGGDGKVDFTLTSDPSIGIQVKARHGDIDTVKWWVSKEEVEKNSVLVCVLIQEQVNEAQSKYNLVLAGFLPTDMIDVNYEKVSFGIDSLLYAGGLHSYLLSFKTLSSKETRQKHQILEIKSKSQTNNQNAEEKNYKPYLNRGNLRYNSGDLQGAIEDYSKVLEIQTHNAYALSIRAKILSELEDYEAAIKDYNKLIKINNQSDIAYCNRGFIHYCYIGNIKEAIRDFYQAIIINPEYIDAYYWRGAALYDEGREQGAIANFTKVIKLNPNHCSAYVKRGLAFAEIEEFEKAIEDYRSAIKIKQDFTEAYEYRGYVYETLGYTSFAIQDLQKAAYLYKEQNNYEKYQILTDALRRRSCRAILQEISQGTNIPNI